MHGFLAVMMYFSVLRNSWFPVNSFSLCGEIEVKLGLPGKVLNIKKSTMQIHVIIQCAYDLNGQKCAKSLVVIRT